MKFKFLEHTADMKFQGFGKTLEEAFENAALALQEVITKGIKIKPIIKKTIKVEGKDKEALLYNFLEEFLFLLDAEDFLLSKFENLKIKEKSGIYQLEASVTGDKANNYEFTNNVKAITYNEMFVKKEKIGKGKFKYICQVVVDV